ncbi:MAG: tRNA preQ1(34) S-adenosylmethionine ribosyltransferase-isomerase QueA [Pseudomonadota bacterium]
MQLSDFDYQLPPELIAQVPLPERAASRLLQLNPRDNSIDDRQFSDLESLLNAGDLLVFNDTRVIPARLFGRKHSGGKVEVLVERILDDHQLLAHVRASKAPKPGTRLTLEAVIECEMQQRDGDLFVLVQHEKPWLDWLNQCGHMPLPPYIQREDQVSDRERYQTVYAREPGAVAAPTAGLHFDHEILANLQQKGIKTAQITLHVGAGTFQPVRVDNVDAHVMHSERLEVSDETCTLIEQAQRRQGRIVAVGTTVVRSLETAAASGRLAPMRGESQLFIKPGFQFNVVDAMLTNFHLPKSTLLMLVSAFAGTELTRTAYRHAVEQRYRFFSYGDAMFIESRAG